MEEKRAHQSYGGPLGQRAAKPARRRGCPLLGLASSDIARRPRHQQNKFRRCGWSTPSQGADRT
jgi:hypothetical protein